MLTSSEAQLQTTQPHVQAMANAINTASRSGPLTTEWWTVLLAGALSTTLGTLGLPGSAAAQVAAIAAPIVLALAYAFARAHTKGALASALTAVFPQAAQPQAAQPQAAQPQAAQH
jgi:hypothetical protein